MGYDNEFYNLYASYLEEPIVRANHQKAFEIFESYLWRYEDYTYLDLGCGLSEIRKYWLNGAGYDEYVGVDREAIVDPKSANSPYRRIVQDYLDLDLLISNLNGFVPSTVVSLFSVEACYPANFKYEFYHKVFAAFPEVERALVSGFYYDSKRDQETVEEAGGLVSYQTIESMYDYSSAVFDEVRIQMKTPSKLFGPDVVEVWKILTRK